MGKDNQALALSFIQPLSLPKKTNQNVHIWTVRNF